MNDDKPDAWMPLYIGDWEGDTGQLDCEQDGAYGRLVRHYWRNGAPRDDDAALARIVRMDLKRWRKVREAIAHYFDISDGLWRHGRVERELARWAEKRRRAIERASAGGRAKAAKSSATSTPQAVLEQCTSSSAREVDGPTGQSTLSSRERPEARQEGASVAHGEPEDSERGWMIDAQRADIDALRCRRSDPDASSEFAEFAAIARDTAAALRRARLSLVDNAA